MSGLAAMLSRRGPVDATAVRRALAAAPHRGMDVAVIAIGSCSLGVQRRPDERHAGIAADDGLAVVVAGSIDDLDALADRFGVVLDDGVSAPAVLLAGFRALGERLPAILRGAFSVAVTDGASLWVFRDQLGLGTLFHRDDGDAIRVATEAKQVVAAARIPRAADLGVLETLFYGEEEDDLPSAIQGVDRLAKASLLHATGQATRTVRYWDPAALIEQGGLGPQDLKPRFDEVMTQALGRVLHGREILALSGGIDSPTLAAYAAPVYRERFGRPLPALSMVFPDLPACDETPYIEAVAERLGIDVHAYQPDPADAGMDRLGQWVTLVDGPWMGAWQPGMDETRYRMMGELGVDRLLTGDIAEYVMDFRHHLVTHLLWQGRIGPLVRLLRVQRAHGSSMSTIARRLLSGLVPGSAFRAYRRARPTFPSPAWVDRRRVRRVASSELVRPWDRWRHQQLTGFRGPGISLEAHRIHQQAHGIEVRHPWGDVDVWEFFLGLRAEDKFPGPRSKELVRRLGRDRLPAQVLDRRTKTLLDDFVREGFDYASIRRWLAAAPDYRMPGVDYARLDGLLETRDMGIFDYLWARDLAAVHAFVAST